MANADKPQKPDFAAGIAPDDIPDTGLLAVTLDGDPWLLARLSDNRDRIVAVSGKCTHLGGPLAEGLRTGDDIHCPWHHARFSLATGRADKAPAFDGLDRREVRVSDGKLYPGDPLAAPKPAAPNRALRIVVIGAGAAGFAAVERLQSLGHEGELHWFDDDAASPYDRTQLSKKYLAGTLDGGPAIKASRMTSQSPRKVTVRSIDRQDHAVELADGERVAYDALLLAPGAAPRHLDLPGFDAPAVHVLRTLADSDALIAAAKTAKRAVVIGGGFIAIETAASLRQRKVEVDVVVPEAAPLVSKVGPELAAWVQHLHETKGVRFHVRREAKAYADGAVVLDDGSRIEADLVVVGAGVAPRLTLAEDARLVRDHAVPVDEQMQTLEDGTIWAAGDIAAFPNGPGGQRIRMEHWVAAERQGQIAAEAMLGGDARWQEAPFFWSAHYDQNIRYCGHADRWDRIEIDGDLSANDAELRYIVDEREAAVATVGRDLAALKASQRLADAEIASSGSN